MNELTLKVVQNPGSIELNFDEIERVLDAKLAQYEGAVFTEESRDIAKKERSGLRKEQENLDTARKNIKKGWMKPYDDFESKVKPLIEKFDKPINLIDSQIKDYEEKCRREKREKIKAVYIELVGHMEEYIPFDKIYDDKWGNVSTSMMSIRKEIEKKVSDTKIAVDGIQAMDSEKTEDALQVYKDTLDMAKAITVISNYERQKAEIIKREDERRKRDEERQRQAEINRVKAEERAAVEREERIRKEERERAGTAARIVSIQEEISQTSFIEPEADNLPFEQPSTSTVFYRVVATQEEIEEMEMVLNGMGIWFERRDA